MAEKNDMLPRNPFATSNPVKTLDALTSASTADEGLPASKVVADTIKSGGKAPSQDAEEALPKGVFKKGLLKGMDKTVFLGFLADTMASLGGKGNLGAARMALENKARREAIVQRQKEVAEERAFRAGEAEKDREQRTQEQDKALTDKDLDRSFQLQKMFAQNDLELGRMQHRLALENEAHKYQTRNDLAGAEVREIFSDIAEFEGLELPEWATPEAAYADPKVRESIRRIVAPYKQRRFFQRLEASGNKSMAKEQRRLLSQYQFTREAWRQGKRLASADDVDKGMAQYEGQPITTGASLNQQTGQVMAGLAVPNLEKGTGPASVMSDELMAEARQQYVNGQLERFRMQGGGALFGLDLELQAQQEMDLADEIGAAFDQHLARLREQIRQQNLAGEIQTDTSQAEAEKRFRQRGAAARRLDPTIKF
jgi:hypothetical protein